MVRWQHYHLVLIVLVSICHRLIYLQTVLVELRCFCPVFGCFWSTVWLTFSEYIKHGGTVFEVGLASLNRASDFNCWNTVSIKWLLNTFLEWLWLGGQLFMCYQVLWVKHCIWRIKLVWIWLTLQSAFLIQHTSWKYLMPVATRSVLILVFHAVRINRVCLVKTSTSSFGRWHWVLLATMASKMIEWWTISTFTLLGRLFDHHASSLMVRTWQNSGFSIQTFSPAAKPLVRFLFEHELLLLMLTIATLSLACSRLWFPGVRLRSDSGLLGQYDWLVDFDEFFLDGINFNRQPCVLFVKVWVEDVDFKRQSFSAGLWSFQA